jgi:hypothetical protein
MQLNFERRQGRKHEHHSRQRARHGPPGVPGPDAAGGRLALGLELYARAGELVGLRADRERGVCWADGAARLTDCLVYRKFTTSE